MLPGIRSGEQKGRKLMPMGPLKRRRQRIRRPAYVPPPPRPDPPSLRDLKGLAGMIAGGMLFKGLKGK